MFKNLSNAKKFILTNWKLLKKHKNSLTKISFVLAGSYLFTQQEQFHSTAHCWFSRLYSNDFTNRIQTLQYAANNPIEDKFIQGNLTSVSGFVSGVFDGHGGWQVSKFVSENFIEVLNSKLETVKNDLSEKNVKKAISETFDTLETNYIELIKTSYLLGFGKLASVGACGLVAVVIDNKLYVANLGDSKGILFSKINREE